MSLGWVSLGCLSLDWAAVDAGVRVAVAPFRYRSSDGNFDGHDQEDELDEQLHDERSRSRIKCVCCGSGVRVGSECE